MESRKRRVAILGIYHESNTFLINKTRFEDFKNGHLLLGDQIRKEYSKAYHEIGGMLEVLDSSEFEPVPIIIAEATPGGTIKAQAYEKVVELFFEELEKAGDLDGYLVVCHGAAVAESNPDMDADWLSKLRRVAGKKPIVATLDPHANVSQEMTAVTNALIAYQTNPHIDQRETGIKAAKLMVETLRGNVNPVQNLSKPSVAISIEQQYTASPPCAKLIELAKEVQTRDKVLSCSVLLGFPYADVTEMGSGFIVITDGDKSLAAQLANELGSYLRENRHQFVGKLISIEDAINSAFDLPKPLLMLDMGDNVGGGSAGDGTCLLEALEEAARFKSFVCLYDPQAVSDLSKQGTGTVVSTVLGGKTDQFHGKHVKTKVKVLKVVNGRFQEKEPRHGGQANYNMGKTVIVETPHRTTIMLTSLRIVPFSLSQLTTFGLVPDSYDVLVAKGVQAPIAAYGPVCKEIIRINTPGVTPADMTSMPFTRRSKPLFPFEDELVKP